MTGLVGVTIALAAHADARDVNFFIGRFTVGQSDPPGRPEAQPRQPCLFQKVPTIGPVSHGCPSLFWYRAPFCVLAPSRSPPEASVSVSIQQEETKKTEKKTTLLSLFSPVQES